MNRSRANNNMMYQERVYKPFKPTTPDSFLYKTRLCKYGDRCIGNKTNRCTFAHSQEELVVKKFGPKNRKNNFAKKDNKGFVTVVPPKPKANQFVFKEANFPKTIGTKFDTGLANQDVVNYTEMKKFLHNVDVVFIVEKTIEDMLKEYGYVMSFKKVVFKF